MKFGAWVYQHPDVLGAGARLRRKLNRPEDIKHAVMGEYARGTLRAGGSGQHVKNRAMAYAIAMSEIRRRNKKKGGK